MNEHPILFSRPMVQANLEDRKSMTRRTKGLDTVNESPDSYDFIKMEIDPTIVIHKLGKPDRFKKLSGMFAIFEHKKNESSHFIKCQYGQPGDLLWVRESFAKGCLMDEDDYFKFDDEGNYIPVTFYKADGPVRWFDGNTFHDDAKYRPSIHMPKTDARIWLQVEEIRVERLNEISEEDAIAEGVETLGLYPGYNVSSRGKFEGLWNLINGDESWDANPWVWVVKYKVLSKTGKPEIYNIQ